MPIYSATELSPAIRIIESFPHPTAAKYNEALWYRQHQNNIVIIDCFATNIHFPRHWSPLSVKCAFGGKEYYHFGNASLSAADDNFLIVNEGAVYESSINTLNPTESFTLNFTPQNIHEVYRSISSTSLQQLDNPFNNATASVVFMEKMYPHNNAFSSVLRAIRKLVKEKEKRDQPYLELCYAALEKMILLYRETKLEIENFNAVRQSTKEEMYKRLTLARDYIDSCFYEDISLHQLSRICFLHPHYLLRQFRKCYAVTPHQYLTMRRLREAAVLLKTGMGIAEITRAVGFSDPGSFSKLFKRKYGRSPESFRASGICLS